MIVVFLWFRKLRQVFGHRLDPVAIRASEWVAVHHANAYIDFGERLAFGSALWALHGLSPV
jgi:hypothetical protein